MSVYIKGFPLPNNCGACPLRLAWCRERIYMVTRPERCPLVPVPPHGRPIDADELADSFEPSDFWNSDAEDNCFAAVRIVHSAPTIIPADVPENNVGNIPAEEGEI